MVVHGGGSLHLPGCPELGVKRDLMDSSIEVFRKSDTLLCSSAGSLKNADALSPVLSSSENSG